MQNHPIDRAAPRSALTLLVALAGATFSVAVFPGQGAAQSCDVTTLRSTERWTEAELCALTAEAADTRTDALYLEVSGVPVLEYRSDRTADYAAIHVMSVTKSVAVLAVGRMLLDGTLDSLDVPIHRFYPEWRQGRKREITLRHLLNHTSGIQNVPNAGEEIEPAPDIIQLALAAELEADPGRVFEYNNKAVNLLGGIVRQLTGRRLDTYLDETVFRDIGVRPGTWLTDRVGNPYVMAGLHLTAPDLARVGRLVLHGGVWQGRAVIDPDFAAALLESQTRGLYPAHSYLWWLVPEDPESEAAPGRGPAGPWVGVQSNGFRGQWVVVIPEAGVVAVRQIERQNWIDSRHSFSDFVRRIAEGSARGH